MKRLVRMIEARAERRRQAIAEAMAAEGVGEVRVEGEAVRLSGPGLRRRWLDELALREAGRGRR